MQIRMADRLVHFIAKCRGSSPSPPRRATSISPASRAAPATSCSTLRAEGRRWVFAFKDRPERCDNAIAFYGEGGSVRPFAFAAAIKDMKALLHNA
jgi:hypothetical protein